MKTRITVTLDEKQLAVIDAAGQKVGKVFGARWRTWLLREAAGAVAREMLAQGWFVAPLSVDLRSARAGELPSAIRLEFDYAKRMRWPNT